MNGVGGIDESYMMERMSAGRGIAAIRTLIIDFTSERKKQRLYLPSPSGHFYLFLTIIYSQTESICTLSEAMNPC